MVQSYIRKVREVGGAVTSYIICAAAQQNKITRIRWSHLFEQALGTFIFNSLFNKGQQLLKVNICCRILMRRIGSFLIM